MKKILLGFGVFIVLLLAAAIAIPFLFKDRIVAEVIKAANEQLTAKLDFSDVDISLFRQFPKLSVGLEDLSLTGTGPFEGVKLIETEQLNVGVDLMAALSGNIIVRKLHLEKPNINVFILENGQANYDITKPSTEKTPETSGESAPIKLESYTISEGNIVYDDRTMPLKAELKGVNHEGSGNLAETLYDLKMKTAVNAMTVDYGGTRYLSKAKLDWTALLAMDMQNSKYTFKENDILLNNLKVLLDGWVQMPNDKDILMDLKFGSPANDFKSLLSIIPGAYTKDFDGVKADGSFSFTGTAKGTYNDNTYPAFNIAMKVGNGSFKYPSLPLGVSAINMDMTVNSPNSNFDNLALDIPKFAMTIGTNPISGFLKVRTPVSDPQVDTQLKGKLNFAELGKAFPIEGMQELTGMMDADVALKARMSQIEKGLYEQVTASGKIDLFNLVYRAEGTPPVNISSMKMLFTPQKVDMPQFVAKVGKSDFNAFGSIDNILAFFGKEKTMTGKMTLRSALIDANELMATPEETASTPTTKAPAPVENAKPFDRWDFTVDGKIDRILYEDYKLSDVRMAGHFTPNLMDLSDFALKIGNSDLKGSGKLLGAWDYLYDNRTLSGNLSVESFLMDLNQFMTDAPTAAAPANAPPPAEDVLLIPENVAVTVDAKMGKVLYSNYTLSNVVGKVIVADQAAKLDGFTADVLNGRVALAGGYDTKIAAAPRFDMRMAVQDMGFPEVWKNVVTIQKLAPIAQYITGKFNTSLDMSGTLGKDMMPNLESLSAAGFLETIQATLNNFKPINEIGSKLNVSALKQMNLNNTRNWFEIKDGMVNVKPFNLKAGDVNMAISGSHGLNTDMKYSITTKTPRSALEKNAAGAAANSGLKWLSAEASKYGVNLAQGEFINVQFDLTGSIASPKVAMKVLGSDGQSTIQDEAKSTAQAAVDKAKDSLQTVAQKELDKAKDKANAAVDKAVDTAKAVINQKVDEVKDKVVKEVKDKVGEQVGDKVGGAIGDKAKDVLGPGADKKVDQVKDKLENWNPLGKKKKE